MTEHDAPGVAPVVVFATGNESRGDDGLAPALVRRAGLETRAGITLVIDSATRDHRGLTHHIP